jgi:hypothetical protein
MKRKSEQPRPATTLPTVLVIGDLTEKDASHLSVA